MSRRCLRSATTVLAVLLTALVPSRLTVHRLQAQSPDVPSRPWTCWSVPATGGAFATMSVSDRVCGSFAADATRIRLAPPSIRPTRIIVPAAPAGLTAAVSGQTVVLAWSSSNADPETTYVLEAGSSAGRSNLANAGTGSSAPSLTATGVPPGRYVMRVRAQTSSGTSAPSNDVIVVVSGACASAGDAPANLTSAVTESTVTLTWGAPASGCTPTSYVIEAGSSPGASNLANFSTGSAVTSFSATGVPSGVYYVRVKASTGAGASVASNEATVTIGACALPSAPAVLASSVNEYTVVLTWSASAGASSYILEAGTASGLTNVIVSDTGSSATSLTATAVPSASYYVRVRARNACATSPPSMENLVVVPGETGSGLLAGATSFVGPYPTPVNIAFVDPTGQPLTALAFPGQVLIFTAGISQASVEAAIQTNGGIVLARTPVLGYYLAGVSGGSEAAFITAMGRVSGVVDVLPNAAGIRGGEVIGGVGVIANAATTVPGATILETCFDFHFDDVQEALVDNKGVYKNCRDIDVGVFEGTSGHSVTAAIQAQVKENGTSPTLINLSTYGTIIFQGVPVNAPYYAALPKSAQLEMVAAWKTYMTAVLNAIAELSAAQRENFAMTICAGNTDMEITKALTDLRKTPRFKTVLEKNVLIASTTLFKANYSTTDGDVAICNNKEAAGGTSFAAPGCLAMLQQVIGETGASVSIALVAVKQAVADNKNHELLVPKAVEKAKLLMPSSPTAPPTIPPPTTPPVPPTTPTLTVNPNPVSMITPRCYPSFCTVSQTLTVTSSVPWSVVGNFGIQLVSFSASPASGPAGATTVTIFLRGPFGRPERSNLSFSTTSGQHLLNVPLIQTP